MRELEVDSTMYSRAKCPLLVLPTVLAAVAALSCCTGIENQRNEPLDIVKRHFVFYPDYSHGEWHQELCPSHDPSRCVIVRYTIPLQGCGPVTFSWLVFPERNTFQYWGTKPSINEMKYPIYAFFDEDSHTLNHPPARGRPLPETCQYK